MDNITRNNSDSDLSDDWNVIDAPPVVSESESIEVLEEENDGDDEDQEEVREKELKDGFAEGEELQGNRNDDSNTVENITGNSDIIISGGASRIELEHQHDRPTYYCVFPEELHNVFTNGHYTSEYISTSEIMCSISLIILCTVASSFMVVSTDNLMPSFLDVLVWQSLPDNQKDLNIKNPGLIIEELNLYKDKNEFLENKLNHVKLAIKAYEENMISETAFVEFVTDLERSSAVFEGKRHGLTEFINQRSLSSLPQPLFQPTSDEAVDKSDMKNFDEINFSNEKLNLKKELTDNDISDSIHLDDNSNEQFSSYRNKKNQFKFVNKLLALFNVSDETGVLLNEASLLLLRNKDRLTQFKKVNVKSSDNDFKFQKLLTRIQGIENGFDVHIKTAIRKLTVIFYDKVKKFDENVSNYVCKNSKGIDMCAKKNRKNMKDRVKHPYKQKNFKINNVQNNKINERPSNLDVDNILYANNNNNNDIHHINEKIPRENNEQFKNKHTLSAGKNSKDKFSYEEKINIDKTKKNEFNHYKKNKDNEIKKEFGRYDDGHKNSSVDWNTGNANAHYSSKTDKRDYNEKRGKINKEYSNKYESQNKKHKKISEVNRKEQKKESSMNLNLNDNNKNNVDKVNSSQNHHNDGVHFVKNNKENKSKIEGRSDNKNYHKSEKNINKKTETEKNRKDKKYHDKVVSKSKYDKQKDNHPEKNKKINNQKLKFDDIRKFKKDILNSIHSYLDDLLMNLKNGILDDNYNNSTIFINSDLISGDWFFNLGQKRSEIRAEKTKSDWLFDRAEGRNNLRDTSGESDLANGFYEQTMWFFRRAWQRNHNRY